MHRSRLLRKVVIAGIIVLAFAAWVASWRIPTGVEVGSAFQSAQPLAAKTSTSLRVATWNIHSGKGRDGIADINRSANRLKGYDFAGLNEVRGTSLSRPIGQAEFIGKQLDAGWLFLPFERTWGRDDFGNAVVSTCPVVDWVRIPFPYSDAKGHGNLSLHTLDWNGTRLSIVVTHIDRERDRLPQLRMTRRLFESLAEPVVLMGDLNTRPDDPELAGWVDAPGVVDVLAADQENATYDRIDWIIVRGLECVASGMEDHGESDHPLVWAELKLPALDLETPKSKPEMRVHLIQNVDSTQSR